MSVVGESYRQREIEYVVAGRPVAAGGNWDATLEVRAALVPEPANPHDRNAVRVDLSAPDGWVTVGYLARETAVHYQPVLLRMVRAGQLPTVEGRICRAQGGPLAVYLHLADADACDLANQPRPDARALRPERPHAVTGLNKPARVIYRSDYLSADREAQLLTLDEEGLPTGALECRGDRLVIVPDGHPQEMVNPRSTSLYRLGIFSFSVRGTSYHESAARSGDFRPGRPVRLVREPDNEHDPNAIAVYAESGRTSIGYVNKQNAKRLTKLLDAGVEFAAISTRGGGPGREDVAPVILAARREVLAHLTRRL